MQIPAVGRPGEGERTAVLMGQWGLLHTRAHTCTHARARTLPSGLVNILHPNPYPTTAGSALLPNRYRGDTPSGFPGKTTSLSRLFALDSQRPGQGARGTGPVGPTEET